MDDYKRRVTVHDVARQAGVSLATVDRVLNGRPGVRAETAEKVADAIRVLDFRRDLSASLLARARDLSVTFLIPDSHNEFMQSLVSAIGRRARAVKGERLKLETHLVHAFDPRALSNALGTSTRGVATAPWWLPPRTTWCGVPSTRRAGAASRW
ncbi:MAG: LacI family DNA-binding transcriptional regulator [Devosia sp.]|nr:LacI family DNA-binding transcriptional regulator [Devosia sp.]